MQLRHVLLCLALVLREHLVVERVNLLPRLWVHVQIREEVLLRLLVIAAYLVKAVYLEEVLERLRVLRGILLLLLLVFVFDFPVARHARGRLRGPLNLGRGALRWRHEYALEDNIRLLKIDAFPE